VECQLRAAAESDREFLYDVYCQTMRQSVEATWGWDEAWQRRDFERRFETCQTFVIESGSRAVGGLLLEPRPGSVDIVELQVLPGYQRMGIGTEIIKRLLEQAVRDGLDVTLSVVVANTRARRLYERLGFVVVDSEGPFIRMRRGQRLDDD
jgi:ribosomal protein S18 acetylase RimI-like enzyme